MEQQEIINKINHYKMVADTILGYIDHLNSVDHFLTEALDLYLDGGYIDRGNTVDRGSLTKDSAIIQNSVHSLNVAVQHIKEKIDELNSLLIESR